MKLFWLLLAMLALLSACAVKPPSAGSSEAEVLQRWGQPSARYGLADGGQRLEYATGPFGRSTWMLDLDSGGRLARAEQVLTDSSLQALQARLPGMPRDELLRTLGTPGERRGGGRQGGEIWSWRYETNECLWFRVSIGDDGQVRDGAFYPDYACERMSDGPP